jgi:HlyD family secretion protein
MNRKILFAATAFALLAGAGLLAIPKGEAQNPALLAAPARGLVVIAPGRVEPATEERDVTAELRGKLAEVLVDEGDKVAEGQIVARLVDAEYVARVAQARAGVALREAELERVLNGARGQERREAQAQVREAQAQLDQAKLDLARREPLARQGHSSGEALDRARTEVSAAEARLRARQERAGLIDARARSEDIDMARAQVALAKGQLAEAEAFLDKTRVRSPIDGTVLHRFKRTGEGVSDQPPTPIVKVGDLSRLRVRVDVDETDVAKVAVGMRAYVTADAWPGRRFEGSVVRVGQRLGRKTLRTDDPTERNDTKVLETLIELDPGVILPVGLRVDAFLGNGPAS